MDQAPNLREYLQLQHNDLVRRLDEISHKQDITNGRVIKAEVDIAILKERAESAHRHGVGGLVTGIGSGLALAASLLWERVK